MPNGVKVYGKKWHKMAYEQALVWVTIEPCYACGMPINTMYCCTWCGDSDGRNEYDGYVYPHERAKRPKE